MSGLPLIRKPRLRHVGVIGALALAVAAGVPAVTAGAATLRPAHATAATVAATGTTPSFPTFVHVPADQAAHPGAGAGDEWWYTVGHVYAAGQEYGYEVQLTNAGMTQIAITDVTTGRYVSQVTAYQPGQFSVSSARLDVRMPDGYLSGPTSDMVLTAAMPHGSLQLHLAAHGPVLYANGTGLFPFLGGTSYYYSLPDLATSGTLTLDGKTARVTGQSWLDRQWGNWDFRHVHRWTWMGIQLKNHEYLNLWDLLDAQGENSWATVLHPDGSESVVPVEPLAAGATDFQTSSTTGQRYAGKWTVDIPSLHSKLTVTASPVLQEIRAGVPFAPGIDEAAANVTGTYEGQPVTGKAYVEQFGHWS